MIRFDQVPVGESMRAVFISDAHIRGHDDPNLPALLSFLDRLDGEADRLFIVGDLFHTWFGFPRAVFDEYVSLLGALERVRRAGVEIVYVTGNHDFEMGPFFTDILQAKVHETQMSLEADGRRAFVAHGDMANPDDRRYRLLRFFLRARPTRWLARRLPPAWIWAIGQRMASNHAGGAQGRKEADPSFKRYADEKFAEGFDTVILGHAHVPVMRAEEGRTYINLGDWIAWRTFLRWEDGELSLRQWCWPEQEEREYAPGGQLAESP